MFLQATPLAYLHDFAVKESEAAEH